MLLFAPNKECHRDRVGSIATATGWTVRDSSSCEGQGVSLVQNSVRLTQVQQMGAGLPGYEASLLHFRFKDSPWTDLQMEQEAFSKRRY